MHLVICLEIPNPSQIVCCLSKKILTGEVTERRLASVIEKARRVQTSTPDEASPPPGCQRCPSCPCTAAVPLALQRGVPAPAAPGLSPRSHRRAVARRLLGDLSGHRGKAGTAGICAAGEGTMHHTDSTRTLLSRPPSGQGSSSPLPAGKGTRRAGVPPAKP